jgi:serine/threonine-protein phosphatase 4 regulatory subunit 1
MLGYLSSLMIECYLSQIFKVTELVKHVSTEPVLLRGLLGDLAEWFAHSKRWNQRQTFALLCSQLVTKRVLSEELFACDVLPHLLELSWDSVPNVRLSVARTVATSIMAQGEELSFNAHHIFMHCILLTIHRFIVK